MTFIERIRIRDRAKRIKTAMVLYSKYRSLKAVALEMGKSVSQVWRLVHEQEAEKRGNLRKK